MNVKKAVQSAGYLLFFWLQLFDIFVFCYAALNKNKVAYTIGEAGSTGIMSQIVWAQSETEKGDLAVTATKSWFSHWSFKKKSSSKFKMPIFDKDMRKVEENGAERYVFAALSFKKLASGYSNFYNYYF